MNVKILSGRRPQRGQIHRSSMNFTTTQFGKSPVIIKAFYNYGEANQIEATEISFDIKVDKRLQIDPTFLRGISSSHTVMNTHHENLYIANPSGATGDFTVVLSVLNKTVKILTTNDIHGRFLEGPSTLDYARFYTYKQTHENCLLIDAGDSTQGTPLAILEKGLLSIEMLNALGYDLTTIGNHEFDNITKDDNNPDGCELRRIIRAFNGTYICANVYPASSAGGKNFIKTVYDEAAAEIGETDSRNGMYEIKTFNFDDGTTANLLFVGITVPIPTDIPRMKDFHIVGDDIDEMVNEVRNAINEAKKECSDIHMVVLLSHLGIRTSPYGSATLAARFNANDNIRLIIDGHSHEEYTENIEDTLITQAGCYSQHFGEISIDFFGEKPQITCEIRKASSLGCEPDEGVTERLSAIKEQVDREFGMVRAKSSNTSLWGGAIDPKKPIMPMALNISRYVPTNMGQFIGESFIHHIKTLYREDNSLNSISPDSYIIGAVNGGGVRAGIAFGSKITDAKLFEVLPSHLKSENESGFVLFEISISDLKEVLENSISQTRIATFIGVKDHENDDQPIRQEQIVNHDQIVGSGRFLNTAGLRYTIKLDKDEDGRAELSIGDKATLTRKVGDGWETKEISFSDSNHSDTKILLCVGKYLAQGGDGYSVLANHKGVVISGTTPGFKIVGEYIQHRADERLDNILYYPMSVSDVAYEGFDFPPAEVLRTREVTLSLNGEEIGPNKAIVYSFADDVGYGQLQVTTTYDTGTIRINPPSGQSIMCIAVPDKTDSLNNFHYSELFFNSYFSMLEENVECDIREKGDIAFLRGRLNDPDLNGIFTAHIDGGAGCNWGIVHDGYIYSMNNLPAGITEIIIRHDGVLYGLSYTCGNSREFSIGRTEGGNCEQITFALGEYITKIEGQVDKSGTAICQLKIYTNLKCDGYGYFGNAEGGDGFTLANPRGDGYYIFGLMGVAVESQSTGGIVISRIRAYLSAFPFKV